MKPIIALGTNCGELDAGGFRDPAVCGRARGSEFCPYLVRLAREQGREVLSGSEALAAVRAGRIDARRIAVVQEEENGQGLALVSAGADPAVLLCMESPLFSPAFYDRLPHWRRIWRRQLLFSGGTDRMWFPSFDADAVDDNAAGLPWAERKPCCAIVSYKHCVGLRERHRDSPTFAAAFAAQLHDTRYRMFDVLRGCGVLDLYGQGWPPESGVRPVADKLATLRRYRYALVIENVRWPGYVTEKVFDALAAGCVPLYMGPEAIGNYPYFPGHVAVAIAPESDAGALAYLVASSVRPDERLAVGRNYLRLPEGLRHSWQGFARDLLAMLD